LLVLLSVWFGNAAAQPFAAPAAPAEVNLRCMCRPTGRMSCLLPSNGRGEAMQPRHGCYRKVREQTCSNVALQLAACSCPKLWCGRLQRYLLLAMLFGGLAPSSGLKQLVVREPKDVNSARDTLPDNRAGPTADGNFPRITERGELLKYANGSVSNFASCNQACEKCFIDHYQGCLAYCHTGCEEYCTEKLPQPDCLSKQRWVARLGHVFQAFDGRARMCQATGVNGCPLPPPQNFRTTNMPFDPYAAHEDDVPPSSSDSISVSTHDHPQVFLSIGRHVQQ